MEKALKWLFNLLILGFIVYFLFSNFQVFNLASLYKDKVEMGLFSLTTSERKVNPEEFYDLLNDAVTLNTWICFYIFSAVISPFIVWWLISKKRKLSAKQLMAG